MSKIGQNPITVEAGVIIEIDDKVVKVTGPKGTHTIVLPHVISAKLDSNILTVSRSGDSKQNKSLHGTFRNLIANAIYGVTKGWEKKVEVVGTGFGVTVKNDEAVFKVGFSHQVKFAKVEGITFVVDGTNILIIRGVDKQLVGQTAHQIRMIKKPDPYKGKGIRYLGEVIKLKHGKKTKTA